MFFFRNLVRMIGGIFIYNHKGEVLISRVYRDDIGLVEFDIFRACLIPGLLFVTKCLYQLAVSSNFMKQHTFSDLFTKMLCVDF